jgi:4,5-DOPA dioxygenase extradiol
VLVLGSGNVVHNLRLIQWQNPDGAFDWAERFDEAAVEQLATDPAGIVRLTSHPDYELAVPTPDHFIPLVYIAGIAAEAGERPSPLVRGYALGSLSMTCYGVGADLGCREEDGAAGLPAGVPADQTNI